MLLPYRKKDLSVCVDLFIAAFSAPPLNYTFITQEKARRYLRDITNTPGFVGFVYEIEGATAAFCFGTTEDYFHDPQYVIKELAVHPALHGKGVGSILMQALEAHMKKSGTVAIALQTSCTIPAYSFYRKLGYTEVEENVSMTKPLA
jgi:ribosomal protein S18 acetylase RimI-like enzyme